MKLMDIINEENKPKYEFGCAMLYFAFPEMKYIHGMIDPNDVYTEEEDGSFGLETEPHTTLLYGLHDGVSIDDVNNVLNKHTYPSCKVHNPSLFKNKQYDVLKFDVEGDSLHDANGELRGYPHTNDYPDYHPHLTVAYLKPGTGNKYIRKMIGLNYELTPQHAVYSQPNGEKTKIKINVD
jgi:hypothetical protein